MIKLFQWNVIVSKDGSRWDDQIFPYAFCNPRGDEELVLVIEYKWWGRYFKPRVFDSSIDVVVGKQPHIPLDSESKKKIFDYIFGDFGDFGFYWKQMKKPLD